MSGEQAYNVRGRRHKMLAERLRYLRANPGAAASLLSGKAPKDYPDGYFRKGKSK